MAATKTTEEPVEMDHQEERNKMAAAKDCGGNPLEEIERLLTCPICLDRYKQPKLLPCQHTFCLSCLESYVESTGGRPRLRCPECRAEHGLSLDGGVQALQTNLTLLAFLEIHMEASAANAGEMQAYVQRFNLERCRVCEEKAELEICAHCERKCCGECRKAHVDMLKRDLSRLLGQVRRLSARVKEASNGLGRGMEHLQANGEQTRQEIRDYFNRYQRELKRREEHFLEQADVFVQTEERLMRTLRDALDVEWNNLQDACLWVDSALSGQREARNEDLARFKLEFQQGLDYLRSFQPDSEELFAKKLRFNCGDDAAKLPTAIANFGELNVSLPQFANRYLPLEQQYLPRPFRMSLESDNFLRRELREREQQREGGGGGGRTFGGGTMMNRDEEIMAAMAPGQESAGAMRWRRRRELEEEAWARLRSEGGGLRVDNGGVSSPWATSSTSNSRVPSRAISPMTLQVETPNEPRSPAKSPVPTSPRCPFPTTQLAASTKKEEPKMAPNDASKMPMAQAAAKVEAKKVETPKEHPANIGQNKEEKEEGEEEEKVEKPEEGTTEPKAEEPSPPTNQVPLATAVVPKAAGAPPAARPPTGLPLAKPKTSLGGTTAPNAGGTPSGIPTTTQSGQMAKNVRAEGQLPPPAAAAAGQTRGRLLMVNGPRSGAAATGAAGGAPRRPGTTHHNPHHHNLHHQHPHGQIALHPKGQKPPLPVRQHSAGEEQQPQQPKGGTGIGTGSRRTTPTLLKREGSQKSVKSQKSKEEENDDDEEEEEEEEEEEDGEGRSRKQPEGGGGGGSSRGRQPQQEIKSQSKRFQIKCRSSSHGRPQQHRPSIETGQPIPVVRNFPLPSSSFLLFPPIPISLSPTFLAFFPFKSTGEWPEQPAPLLLSRSRTNPDLAAELAVAQSPLLGRRRQSREEAAAAAASTTAMAPIGATRMARRNNNNSVEDAITGSFDYEGMRPRPRLVLGGRGNALGQLNWPRGICPLPDSNGDEEDLFAVADSSNHRVQIFSAHQGTLIHSFGSFGTGDGEFDGCCSVCVHKSRGELLVADRYNHRVQIFDLRGRFIRKFGCRGVGPSGQFQHCWGIAVDDPLGLVYVVDKDNHRVQLFDAEGAFLTKFGTMGDGANQFNHPLYIAFHPATRLLYVSDSANNRICVYSPDGSPVRQFQGQIGPPEGQLKLPRGITLDERGRLLVADSGNNRIQVFSPDGQCLRQFGTWGAAPGQFKGVEGICLLGNQLAIADRENNRVQLFSCSAQQMNY